MGVLKRFRFRIGKMKRKKRNSSSGFLLKWGLHIGRELQLTYPLSQMFLVAPQNLPPPSILPLYTLLAMTFYPENHIISAKFSIPLPPRKLIMTGL